MKRFICTFHDLFALFAIFWKENPKSAKMIVFEAFFGQYFFLPDRNEELKLIQKEDRFLRIPRRALGMHGQGDHHRWATNYYQGVMLSSLTGTRGRRKNDVAHCSSESILMFIFLSG